MTGLIKYMGIKILTIKEAKETKKICKQYNECFEMVTGKAKENYRCDNSNEVIPQGEVCAVVLVLPNKNHPNYEHQKSMLKDYII